MPPAFASEAAALLPALRAVRRALHTFPEVGLQLPQTQAYLLDRLKDLDVEVLTGESVTSITVIIRGAVDGDVVLLRGDMDGLPVTETSGVEFASTIGTMHACGHDLHMTGLLGAVTLLAAHKASMRGTVVAMFQPGEESYRGAEYMLNEGVLDVAGKRPVAAYGIHVDPAMDGGTVQTRVGSIMASIDSLDVTITGTGGHAAYAYLSTDPIPAAAAAIQAIQAYVARRVPATESVVASVTRLNANTQATNVLATWVNLYVSIRAMSAAARTGALTDLPRMIEQVAQSYGCTAEVTQIKGMPVTYNDPEETRTVMAHLTDMVGAEVAREMNPPSMASEDFSLILEQVPGTFMFVGARPANVAREDAKSLHNESAVFDDDVVALQARTLAELAWRRLGNPV
jgi:amidohydrolase